MPYMRINPTRHHFNQKPKPPTMMLYVISRSMRVYAGWVGGDGREVVGPRGDLLCHLRHTTRVAWFSDLDPKTVASLYCGLGRHMMRLGLCADAACTICQGSVVPLGEATAPLTLSGPESSQRGSGRSWV